MSHIDSITPAGPITVSPGQSVFIDVLVSGVPGDEDVIARFAASNGSQGTVTIRVDKDELEGILTGTPEAHQVLGELVTGSGSLESVGPITGGWQFRYVAAA